MSKSFVSSDPCKKGEFSSASVLSRRISDAFRDDRQAFTRKRERWSPEKPISPYDGNNGERFRADRAERIWRGECRLDAADREALKAGQTPVSPILPDPFIPAPTWRADWNGDPLSDRALIAEFGVATTADDTVEGARGFRIGDIKDADRLRRPKVNRDRQYRDRASLREACRHDPSEFGRHVRDGIVDRYILNRDELSLEALEVIAQPESDPGLEAFRRCVIAWGKLGESLPFAWVYFDRKAECLAAEGYRETPPRTPRRLPGAVTGAHAACAEQGLALDDLETAIADGSKPIVRRHGIVVALRKAELPKHPKYPPPPTKPASSAVRRLTPVADNSATIPPAVKVDGGERLAA